MPIALRCVHTAAYGIYRAYCGVMFSFFFAQQGMASKAIDFCVVPGEGVKYVI